MSAGRRFNDGEGGGESKVRNQKFEDIVNGTFEFSLETLF